MYRIIILPEAPVLWNPSISLLQKNHKQIILAFRKLDDLSPLPLRAGFSGTYRLRVGDWRVIYSCDIERHSITIHLPGHRRDIYRLS